MPADQIPAGASTSTPQTRSALFGAMIRRNLAPGEVILPADLMLPSDHGFLAAVLEPGMRAMTLAADTLASDIDLVAPGDHVDIILTQQADPSQAASAGRRVFGDTVLSDVRILAVDQQLVQGVSAEQGAPKGPRTVTVEVLPDQAARLVVAARLGKLAFAIRASNRVAGAAGRPATTTTWAGDVSPGLGKDITVPAHRSMRIWQGSADGKEFQF